MTDSSTTRRAPPLCLDLTFPSGATQEEEEEEKTETRKLKGFWEFFCHVSLQTVCLHAHIRPWERDTKTDAQHRCIDAHGDGGDPPGSRGLSRRLILLPTWNASSVLQHRRLSVYGPVYSGAANYEAA